MSLVNNGRIKSTDQKVTKEYENNYDEIKWKSKNERASKRPSQQSEKPS